MRTPATTRHSSDHRIWVRKSIEIWSVTETLGNPATWWVPDKFPEPWWAETSHCTPVASAARSARTMRYLYPPEGEAVGALLYSGVARSGQGMAHEHKTLAAFQVDSNATQRTVAQGEGRPPRHIGPHQGPHYAGDIQSFQVLYRYD